YGKEKDQLTFFAALVGFFINYFDLDSVFLENSDVKDSVEMDYTSFDVILSKVSRGNRLLTDRLKKENIQTTKRNKRMELEDVLNSNFNMDLNSLSKDLEFNDALESLVDKMELDVQYEFFGEYESLKDSEFLFLINLLNTLKRDGTMLISISQNFLLKNSLKTLRKYLTYENNYIDTIISIPSGHVRSVYPQIILVFKKDKFDDSILFIDLSKNISNKKSLNRYSKAGNSVLDNDDLSELVDVYLNKKTIDKFSNLVSIEEIEKNNFNLSISRYIDTYEGEFVKLEDLKQEKIDISKKMSILNKKIKDMLDDLEINH
ncbi:MAG: N-6 DNA methylase, partial [Methanobrevibacter sp.]|nr:N-6 DNA methylase [Methanobrevibacter sp.]